jgi:hypothetical protein
MASIKLHAGDWGKGSAAVHFGQIVFPWRSGLTQETRSVSSIKSVMPASEQNVKKFAGSAGWGAVGALALGPLGLLAGVLAGGNKKEVTFIAEFGDGKKFLGTTDNKTYTKLLAAGF